MQRTATQFSFVIVNYKTFELTRAAIVSVLRHRRQFAVQIIVVDNNSGDGSGEKLQQEFPEVEFVFRRDNGGYAVGCNAGAKLAKGDWIVLLNSDAEILEDTLEQSNRILSAENPGILGAQLLNSDGSLQKSVLTTKLQRKFERRNQHIDFAKVNGIVGAFMIIRANLWASLGGLDEKFFFFFEETDFCRRALQRGENILWSPKIRVLHHLSKSVSGVPARLRSNIEFWKSNYYYQKKHRGKQSFILWAMRVNVELLVNFLSHTLALVLTLGMSKRLRYRIQFYLHRIKWHLAGCPDSWGFKGSKGD